MITPPPAAARPSAWSVETQRGQSGSQASSSAAPWSAWVATKHSPTSAAQTTGGPSRATPARSRVRKTAKAITTATPRARKPNAWSAATGARRTRSARRAASGTTTLRSTAITRSPPTVTVRRSRSSGRSATTRS